MALRLIVYFLFLFSCCKAESTALKTVLTAKIKRDYRSQPIHVSGRLARKTTMRLAFNIDGLVDMVNVKKGDVLVTGQLLAMLDNREIQARVQMASSAYKTALEEHLRVADLHHKNLLSLSEVEQSQNRLAAAKSELEVVKFNKSLSTIKAPIGGVVMEKLVEENELIKAKQTAFIIATDKNGWIVNVEVPDHEVVRMKIGDPAQIRLRAYEDKIFEGRVSEIAAQADQKGVFSVDVKLNGHMDSFRTGYLASVDIMPVDLQMYSYISLDSVVEMIDQKAKFFAFDKRSNTVIKMLMDVQFITTDSIAVKEPIENFDEVVIKGAEALEDGDQVGIFENL